MKFQTFLLAIACLVGTVGISLPVKANSSDNIPVQIAQAGEVNMTVVNANQIKVTIRATDGFKFDGTLKRTSGQVYIASDRQVRVIYDRSTSELIVINLYTGDEMYRYTYSTVDEGSL